METTTFCRSRRRNAARWGHIPSNGSRMTAQRALEVVRRAVADLVADGQRPNDGEGALAILNERGLSFGVGPIRTLPHALAPKMAPLIAAAEDELALGRFPIIVVDEVGGAALVNSLVVRRPSNLDGRPG